MKLQNKVCIITGAGNGQGRAAAILFAQEGASVVVADFDEKAGKATVEEITNAGNRAAFIKTDVSKEEEVAAMVRFAIDTYGKLDVLYNNAGVSSRPLGDSDRIESVPMEAWEHNISINLRGPFLCMKYAIPEMLKNGKGSIINTSSTAGINGANGCGPFFNNKPSGAPVAYNAAKGGVIAMSRGAAIAYGNEQIRVNVICPGPIDTQLMASLNLQDEAVQAKFAKSILLQRIGQCEDIAKAALFLASEDSSWVTAQVICIDGGLSAY